jgi:hypothetical protein
MKLTRFNYIDMYVDCTLNFRGKDIKIKWTTEDGLIDTNFESVFFDLDAHQYTQAYDDFIEELPIFDLDIAGLENE